MIPVNKNIALADFNKLALRPSRGVLSGEFEYQLYSDRTTNFAEFFMPSGEVLILPRGSGYVCSIAAVKYDYRLDTAAGRYNASFTLMSTSNGTHSVAELVNTSSLDVISSSAPGTVQIGIDFPFLPNVPNQRYLRFQTRGVNGVDTQWALRIRLLGTQAA